jgi:hypothetical protein
MAEPDLSVVLPHLDAPQQLQARRLRDAPPKVAFPPEPLGVLLALLQALLDAQVSAQEQVPRASRPSVLPQAQEQVAWEQSWVQQALLSTQPPLGRLRQQALSP